MSCLSDRRLGPCPLSSPLVQHQACSDDHLISTPDAHRPRHRRLGRSRQSPGDRPDPRRLDRRHGRPLLRTALRPHVTAGAGDRRRRHRHRPPRTARGEDRRPRAPRPPGPQREHPRAAAPAAAARPRGCRAGRGLGHERRRSPGPDPAGAARAAPGRRRDPLDHVRRGGRAPPDVGRLRRAQGGAGVPHAHARRGRGPSRVRRRPPSGRYRAADVAHPAVEVSAVQQSAPSEQRR